MKMTRNERIALDRLWREPEVHDWFLESTGITEPRDSNRYHSDFRVWAKGLLDGGSEEGARRLAATKFKPPQT